MSSWLATGQDGKRVKSNQSASLKGIQKAIRSIIKATLKYYQVV